MYPDDRRYTKEHEWVRVQGDRGTVGITDYAQKQLGDVVFLELLEAGRQLKAGDQFGTVESVKAVSELYAPVAGEIVEINSELVAKPETVNVDPHGAAWMIVVPSSFSLLNRSMISLPCVECRLPVGSSARITLGFEMSARATATSCCWPPDSWLGKRSFLPTM